MGYTSYNSDSRKYRAASMGYATNSVDDNFQQNKKRLIHESMDPKSIKVRECFDSEAHPLTFPIVFGLDITGSMLGIPQYLVQHGLPKIMGKIIQKGVPDAALLFLGIGDHECDKFPLQVGQFESGDLELDMWLTRTYLEGGGGGNRGESYMLAWYFAAFHTAIDHFKKRGKKGLLVTTGDEPVLEGLPLHAIKGLMDYGIYETKTSVELLTEAQKMYDVYHIHILHTAGAARARDSWVQLLGENCIAVKAQEDVSNVIIDLVLKHAPKTGEVVAGEAKPSSTPPREDKVPREEDML